MKTVEQIINEIYGFIQQFGHPHSAWYVGIASDPEDRLFNGHNVNRQSDLWVYHPCMDAITARSVESAFLNVGFDGGSGGGDHTTRYLYAYKKAEHTNE